MLSQLRFQNFKSWRDTGDIRLAPLTGLFGTNSSGKTSILQFLLMLKQTVESLDRQRILDFGSDRTYVDLGTSFDIAHQHQLPSQLSYSIQWLGFTRLTVWAVPSMPNFPGDHLIPFHAPYRGPLSFSSKICLGSNDIYIDQLTYTYEAQNVSLANILEKSNGANYPVQTHPASIGMSYNVDSSNSAGKSYNLFSEGFPLPDLRDRDEPVSAPTKNYLFPREADIQFRGGEFLFQPLGLAYERLFQKMFYLGPLRDYPRRIYAWSGEQPQDVGRRGEYFIQALLAGQKREPRVDEQVASWLQRLGLIHAFQLRPIAENRREYEIQVKLTPNATEVPITDVGFGVSQILPVLTLCYYVPEGSILILEQPEIHLHPSVQAGLADVFIEVIKTRNVQIILESHSEHLLRRLQRRIAEEKDQIQPTDAALYFCEMTDAGCSQLTELTLDAFGNINNWPDRFFGDEMGDLVAMTEAAIQRQMSTGNP